MEFRTLEGVSDQDILKVFNLSFSDYSIPFQLTLQQLQSKMKTDNTDLELSVGVYDGSREIAFVLHGRQEKNGKALLYNGGTGVIPIQRGQALTTRMYDYIIPKIVSNNIDGLILEVITTNVPAIKSYKKIGYHITRKVNCYKGDINLPISNCPYPIKRIEHYDWPLFKSFWDFTPTTQNGIASLDKLNDTNVLIGALHENKVVGYLVYNPLGKRIQQFAVSKKYRHEGIAKSMFYYIQSEYNPTCTIINVDKSSTDTHRFLLGVGLKDFLSQYEMEMMF